MKVFFIGSVKFSLSTFKLLIQLNINIVGVYTKKVSSPIVDKVDLSSICRRNKIPVQYSENINSPEEIDWINRKKPDVIFCFGWSSILKPEVLGIAPLGVIGFHPTILPKNRGRHPIIWTIILGLKETGSTFFFMDENADSGPIISQKIIKNIKGLSAEELYEIITNTALNQLREFLPLLFKKEFNTVLQINLKSNLWRKRGFEDGRIDWRMNSDNILRLIKGLSKPYPGAHFNYKNKIHIVWNAKVINKKYNNIEPGKILDVQNNSFIIKTGDKALIINKYEPLIRFKIGDYI